MNKVTFIVLVFTIQLSDAQESAFIYNGLLGECIPRHISINNTLSLYSKPDKRSMDKKVAYGANWYIPYRKSEGVTKVISIGKIKTKRQLELEQCKPPLPAEHNILDSGVIVDYLFYVGEGYGLILYHGSQCEVPVDESFETFDLILQPEVQQWLKVLYKDGSSPGWLLNDSTQTIIEGIDC